MRDLHHFRETYVVTIYILDMVPDHILSLLVSTVSTPFLDPPVAATRTWFATHRYVD